MTAPGRLLLLSTLIFPATASAAIGVSGITDKTKYSDSVTVTVTADPAAASTIAILDDVPFPVGSPVVVDSVRYHELKAESRDGSNSLIDSKTIRFIVKDSTRGGTEDGIPTFTPYRTVNDAPSAFAGGVFQVIAPAVWPAGLPIPIATILRDSGGEPLWLNGTVAFGGFPGTSLQMRRGWGSIVVPALSIGTHQIDARVAGLTANPAITIESPVFTDVSGTLSSDETWSANSRHHVTGTLTINAGATLTIEEGSIITLYSGNGNSGSGAEIVVNGTLRCNGVNGNPVTFAPDTPNGKWGGIELPSSTSNITANQTIFTGSGEDQAWFNSHSGYSTHKPQQALFLLSGSGSGTNVGARVHLSECYAFSLAGQEINSKTNTWVDLGRSLMQRAVTCGELNGSKVTIDRSALIEFPSETAEFVDADNDAIYLTNGDLSITNSVIGYTKDDGVDSGGGGGDNPFTAATDITPFVSTHNWFEGAIHEGNSLSGSHLVTQTSCVFMNNGQGIEDGYSNSGTSDGPDAVVDHCLFVGNMVGIRWGDNYGSGYSYNGAMEVKNSLVLNNLFKDAFSGQWRADQPTGWTYQSTAANSSGNPYFNVHDNHLSQPDPLHHPLNSTWNPETDGSLIEPFMPVPGSDVGVAISSYQPAQQDSAAYPGTFTVRLSTFSSKPVSVEWAVLASDSTDGGNETSLASGSLSFSPGEITKTITPAVASPGSHAIIRLALSHPVNAEVTGEAWFFGSQAESSSVLVALGASGWRYRETRTNPPAEWKSILFDDSSPTATEWLPCTLPAGFSSGSSFTPSVSFNTSPGYGPSSNDKTKTYYFRKSFNVQDPGKITTLTFNVQRDDGIVMWLNDDSVPTALSANGSFPGPYTYESLAPNSTISGSFLSYDIPASKLVAGTNVIAIELHQSSVTSSDLLLNCDLVAGMEQPLELHLANSADDLLLYWFDSAALLEESADLQTWVPQPTATSPRSFKPTAPSNFFRLRK